MLGRDAHQGFLNNGWQLGLASDLSLGIALKEISRRVSIMIQHRDRDRFRIDDSLRRKAELLQNYWRFMFSGQLMPQIDQHPQAFEIRILQFAIFLAQQLCLSLDLAGFLEQLDKDGNLGTQDRRLYGFHDVINRAQ